MCIAQRVWYKNLLACTTLLLLCMTYVSTSARAAPVDVGATAKSIAKAHRMDPLRGLDDLDALNIDPADLASADAVALLEARADLLSAARRPFAAAALRRDVVRRRTTTPALASTGTPFGTIIALIALAQDERDTGDIPAALRAAREAMDMAGSDMALRRVIRAMEANLLDCAGDAAAALAAAPVPVLLARARKARRGATDSSHNAPTREEVNDALTYLQLLRRARAYHSRAKQLDVDAASGGSVDVAWRPLCT